VRQRILEILNQMLNAPAHTSDRLAFPTQCCRVLGI
jgi:hypothetical protein